MSEPEPTRIFSAAYGASDEELAAALARGCRAYWWMMTVGVAARGEELTAVSVRLRTSEGVVVVEPGETPRDVYARVLENVAQRLGEDPGLDAGQGLAVLDWDLRPNDPLV